MRSTMLRILRLAAGIEEAGNDAANIAGEGDRQTLRRSKSLAAFVVCCSRHVTSVLASLSPVVPPKNLSIALPVFVGQSTY